MMTEQRIDAEMDNRRVEIVTEITDLNVLSADPTPLRPSEVVWSRSKTEAAEGRRGWYITAKGRARLTGYLRNHGQMRRSSMVFVAPERESGVGGDLQGSGICVRTGQTYGLLTARHVLMDRDGELRHPKGLFARFFAIGEPYTAGFAVRLSREKLYAPRSRLAGQIIQPGLPDVAILRFSKQDLDAILQSTKNTKGPQSVGEPEWLDLDHLQEIDYEDSKAILGGGWFLTGGLGERSRAGFVYMQITSVFVDRVYLRAGFTYYGLLHGAVEQDESDNQNYKGTSGGPLWQQRLTPAGLAKLGSDTGDKLTPEDLGPPILSGVAFFQRPHETGRYRSELYCQRLDNRLIRELKKALRDQ